MREQIENYFLSQQKNLDQRDRLSSLMYRLLQTEIGTSLLAGFKKSGGTIVFDDEECERRRALGIYNASSNVVILCAESPSTTLCHELAHARQYRVCPALRDMYFPSISMTSDAHLSVLMEADSWALCGIFWKQFIRDNSFVASMFIEEEMQDLLKMEDIFSQEDNDLNDRLRVYLKNKDVQFSAGFAQLTLAAASISKMALDGIKNSAGKSDKKICLEIAPDNPNYDVISEILPEKTDLSYAANMFQEYVLGEGRGGTVASRYIERSLGAHDATVLTIKSSPLSSAFKNVEAVQRHIPPLLEEHFYKIIRAFGDLSDLNIGNYSDFLSDCVAIPSAEVFNRAEACEWQHIERSL